MAYQKRFNPDALPAHAQPDEAAQAMSHLRIGPNQSPNQRPTNTSPNGQHPQRRQSPPRDHRPQPIQSGPQQYHSHNQHNQYNQHNQHNQHNPHPQNTSDGRLSSPPPNGYGWGPRPEGPPQAQRRPQVQNDYPSRTPAPPDPDSQELYTLFRAANISRTGSLTTTELGSALVNADFTPFDPLTIKSLMTMFSSSPAGQQHGPTITYSEFQNMWRFLAAWRDLFERFDEDRSGKISLNEFSNALVAFGYRLSASFVSVLYTSYGGQGSGRRPSVGTANQGMSFDLFVQACISLKRMTDVFKGYDEDRDGYVTLSFEEFLTEILRLRD